MILHANQPFPSCSPGSGIFQARDWHLSISGGRVRATIGHPCPPHGIRLGRPSIALLGASKLRVMWFEKTHGSLHEWILLSRHPGSKGYRGCCRSYAWLSSCSFPSSTNLTSAQIGARDAMLLPPGS